ncbi:transposase [Kitasatospora cineracea]|uniref:transposase n=1 Tax=Kitasatospora cineracea TaxID=88074 RepID=UPI0037952607
MRRRVGHLPAGKTSSRWSTPRSLAPYVTANFTVADCRSCPLKVSCTRIDARTVTFQPRELFDVHSEFRTEQQTQKWLSRYSLRSASNARCPTGHSNTWRTSTCHNRDAARCRSRQTDQDHFDSPEINPNYRYCVWLSVQ